MFVVVMEILLFIWCGWEFNVFKDLLDVLGVVVWLNKIKNLKKERERLVKVLLFVVMKILVYRNLCGLISLFKGCVLVNIYIFYYRMYGLYSNF